MQETSQQTQRLTPDPDGLKAFRDDANAREKSNVEAYDRAVLTLATALLGVSLTFINGIVELRDAIWLPMLYASWGMLVLTVALTLASFLYGLHSIQVSRALAPRYFLLGDDSVTSVQNTQAQKMHWLRHLSAALFASGLTCLALFVVFNIHHEATVMSTENRGPGWVERGLPAGSFESFSTPQVQPTSQPAGQPAAPAASESGMAPAAPAESGAGGAGE